MKRSHRTLLTALKVLALLAVLLAAVWVYFDVSYGRQLDRELAKLRAEGAPLSLAEAAPKAPPPDQNAATLYMPIFQVNFDPKKPEYPKDAKGLRRFQVPDTYRPGDWASVEAMRPVLSNPGCRNALVALREASLRPQCVFPVRWQDGLDAESAHLRQLSQAVRLCSGQAMLEAKAGNVAGALEWLDVCYRMADQASQDPRMIAQYVGFAIVNTANGAAQSILNAGDVPPAFVEELRAGMNSLHIVPRFDRAALSERAVALDTCRNVGGIGTWMLKIGCWSDGPDVALQHRAKEIDCLAKPYWKLEELNLLRDMGQCIERSRQPYRIGSANGESDWPSYEGFGKIVAGLWAPVLGCAAGRRDQALAGLDILRTGFALKLIKRATGGYPATLDALGPCRARDLFTSRDFVYQRVGQGFKLYSVGINLRDDHGVGYQRKPDGTRVGDTDDIVWECPR